VRHSLIPLKITSCTDALCPVPLAPDALSGLYAQYEELVESRRLPAEITFESTPVQMLERADGRRMPRYRPPIPPERIGFIRTWIAAGAPDDPPGAIGVAHEPDPAPEPPA
jgi:hypothetical protein